jgi:anti-sigma regulatory factor (Ser/Thr protein kinase)
MTTPTEPALPESPTVLLVDDAPADLGRARDLIDEQLGWPVLPAADGRAALGLLDRAHVVVTATTVLGPDGEELFRAAHRRHPEVPVTLLVAPGSEAATLEALQAVAATYVLKRHLARWLAPSLESVWCARRQKRAWQLLRTHQTGVELSYALPPDRSLVPTLVAHLRAEAEALGFTDSAALVRIGVALEEALLNAILHGNLELNSALREDGDAPFLALAEERRRQAPYRDRRVAVSARLTRAELAFVIRDEGPGFDLTSLPDPTDPANLERPSGRGLLLIRTFMDEVRHNACGNEITLVYRARGVVE